MSYFPLDRDILSSSLWFTGTPEAFKVWCYLMLKANPRTGVVDDSVPSIAGQCALPIDATIEALEWLASPDQHSRSKELDGRRIERGPAGIRLVNYLARRDKDHSTERVKKFRAKKRDETVGNGSETASGTTDTETETETTDNGTPLPPKGECAEVFAYWQAVMDHATAKLTPGRERCIKARLKDGYTVDQLKQAIDGCRASPFHQGGGPDGKVFDDLTLICRNGEKVEQFVGLLAKAPTAVALAARGNRPSAFPTRSERNKAAVVEFMRGGAK